MATIPAVCDKCGTVFGSEALTGAEGENIELGGAKVGPCPVCEAPGSVPEGTFDLINETLRVVKAAAIEKIAFDALIEVLEDRAEGKVTDKEVMERVEATAPAFATTVKGHLGKPDVGSWLTLLVSVLMMLQSSSAPSAPTAEEIANAIWAKSHTTPAKVAPAAPKSRAGLNATRRRQPKIHGKAKQRKSRKRR
jgi:hypothetical protein